MSGNKSVGDEEGSLSMRKLIERKRNTNTNTTDKLVSNLLYWVPLHLHSLYIFIQRDYIEQTLQEGVSF